MKRRWVMCSGSSSSITERGPSSGPSSGLASPRRRTSLGAVVSTLPTSSGSLRNTHVPSVADAQGENIAVASLTALHERQRAQRPADRLQGAGHAWTRGQRRALAGAGLHPAFYAVLCMCDRGHLGAHVSLFCPEPACAWRLPFFVSLFISYQLLFLFRLSACQSHFAGTL